MTQKVRYFFSTSYLSSPILLYVYCLANNISDTSLLFLQLYPRYSNNTNNRKKCCTHVVMCCYNSVPLGINWIGFSLKAINFFSSNCLLLEQLVRYSNDFQELNMVE